MTSRGLDYSWGRPGGAIIQATGWQFVMRYVAYPGDGGKGLAAEEVANLRAHGIAIGLVFESTAGRALDGYDAGAADAQQCAESISALGFPEDRPIYFAVDFDAQSDQFAALDNYLSGCASVLGAGRVGIYGSYAVVEHCRATGSAAWFWQTYAWSHGQKADGIHVYQYQNGQTLNNAAVDYNEAYGDDFGQWKAEGEEDMTPEQFERLFDKRFEERMSARFPNYLAASFEKVSYAFSDRDDIPEAPMTFPYKPWLDDIEAARCRHTTVPGIARDGQGD